MDAVYHDGVFQPAQRPSISDGARVRLTVETVAPTNPDAVLELAAAVYAGLSAADVADVETMACRRTFFTDRVS